MQSIYLAISAWREVLAQTLGDSPAQDNVSPPWLVNPATQRRLKLDRYYPDVGLAIRFVGLTAKGQKRQSDWEALETEQRDQTRAELCRMNGVQLAIIDPVEEPLKQMDQFMQVLSLAKKAPSPQPSAKNSAPVSRNAAQATLQNALQKASALRSRMAKNPEQFMATLAECWRDRETGMINDLAQNRVRAASQTTPGGKKKIIKNLGVGQTIEHERFGVGQIVEMDGKGAEERISILFQGNEQPRTFLLELVRAKLSPVKVAV
ncbi:MAG: hypothetical protein R2911_12355 [Caldilineaceae bacterium]